MECSICKTNLEEAIFYNTGIHYCPGCLGLWFAQDQLRQAKNERDKDLSWLDIDLWKEKSRFKVNAGEKLCPDCRLPLYEVSYGDSEIKVDICNLCSGVWLDRGEFLKIIDYLEKRKDYELLHNYVKTLRQEFQEIFTGPKAFQEEVSDFLAVLKILNYKFIVNHPLITKIILRLPK